MESRSGAVATYAPLRFHSPLIKPDVRFSRIRLSDKVIHAVAHGGLHVLPSSWSRPNSLYR